MHKLTTIFSQEEISNRIQGLGEEISQHYHGEPVTVICVLKGAIIFFSDLIRKIKAPLELDFIRLASYGENSTASHTISFTKDVEISLKDKHILIVEDVIDSGNTMAFLMHQLEARGTKSIKIATLVDKIERREKIVQADFIGFQLSSGFIVGYGLDYNEQYRELPAIYEIQL